MGGMSATIVSQISSATFAMVLCGTVIAQGLQRTPRDAALGASRVTFGDNLFIDPCGPCKYYTAGPSGFSVEGPRNCTSHGTVLWVAIPFIASATGVPERIYASLLLRDPERCPTNKVTLGIYSDACYPIGVGDLLVSAEATIPETACALTVAELGNAPNLTAGTKYWVAATTSASEADLDAIWAASNNAEISLSDGTNWTPGIGHTPGFAVQGTGTIPDQAAARRPFATTFVVDPCTGCNYDPKSGGFELRGPNNCSAEGQTNWVAYPFIASHSGIPKRILAGINLYSPTGCPYNKVTLSLYTDNCGLGPGTALVSGQGTVPSPDLCGLTLATLANSASLTKATKYWVVAATALGQAALDARWFGSNNGQLAINSGFGWLQFAGSVQAIAVE
jgi:hypothetical protein